MREQNNAVNSLAHSKWNCKYHIVFAPKYRRKVFFQEKRVEVREILRTLCQWKGVEIIEGEICPDHVHLLVSIPPKMSVSGFVGYLKGKIGKNTKAIQEYIAGQLKRDQEADQLSIYDPRDPFTGSK